MRLKDLKPYEILEEKIKQKQKFLPDRKSLLELCIRLMRAVLPVELQ
jgi:stage III sporulation protein SpoIIIAA